MPRYFAGFGLVVLLVTGCRQVDLVSGVTPETPVRTARYDVRPDQAINDGELSPRQSAEACFVSAEELEAGGWDQEAIVAYERTLQFDPKHAGVAHRLARLYAGTGQVEQAAKYFQSALRESPGNAEVLGDFGYFLFEQGDSRGAETNLREAVRLDATNQRNRMNLAVLLASTQRVNESLKLFEQTVGPAAARFNLAVLLARSGNASESRRMLGEAELLAPEMPQAKAFRAWLDGNRDTPPELSPSATGVASAKLNL